MSRLINDSVSIFFYRYFCCNNLVFHYRANILNESIKHNDPSQRPVERTNLYIGVESDIENSFIGRYNDGRDLNTFLFTLALLGECMGTDIVGISFVSERCF